MEIKRIAILGRPNVGKSRLFNRLAGSSVALVCDHAGLTRDYQEAPCAPPYEDVTIIDTPGLIPGTKTDLDLQARLNEQSLRAARLADALLFVIDGREGVTPTDHGVAVWLRAFFKHHPLKPVLLVLNKLENTPSSDLLQDAQRLGWGEPALVSAEHGQGMSDLYHYFSQLLSISPSSSVCNPQNDEAIDDPVYPIRIAIMGRPNAGKSTLMNALLGEDRVLTGPEAGLTRDAITLPYTYKGRSILLIDTAGQRRAAKVVDAVERMTLHDGREALRYADVAIVVMDAAHRFEKQDLSLAQHVLDEGRVLILALNKCDQVEEPLAQWQKKIHADLDYAFGHLKNIPWFPISAQQHTGLNTMLDGALKSYKDWNRRIPTAQLNRWLKEAVAQHAPPASQGVVVRAKYITQIKARPPTFHLFVSRAAQWPESYMRYLTNNLCDTFRMQGIPIRIHLRQSRNPYA